MTKKKHDGAKVFIAHFDEAKQKIVKAHEEDERLNKIINDLVILWKKYRIKTADGEKQQRKAIRHYLRSQYLTPEEIQKIMLTIMNSLLTKVD